MHPLTDTYMEAKVRAHFVTRDYMRALDRTLTPKGVTLANVRTLYASIAECVRVGYRVRSCERLAARLGIDLPPL